MKHISGFIPKLGAECRLKASLVLNTAQTIRANLLANATHTTLNGLLALNWTNHFPKIAPVFSGLAKMALAPWINNVLKCLLPRLLIPSKRGFPPVEC